MAIVINGSGTVTGISVGGLPDGIVDAGTLATNSVDSAELIDGSIDNSHIDAMAASKLTGALPVISGANLTGFTASQMPAGSVVQWAGDTDGDYINLNTNAWVDTQLSITFTPKFSDSLIVLQAIVNLYVVGASLTHGLCEAKILKDDVAVSEYISIYSGYGGGEANNTGTSPMYSWVTQGNTNAEVYKVQVRNPQTASGGSHNQYSGKSALFIWEVKV